MKAYSLGKIKVTSPGTPVGVSSDRSLRVACLRFQAVIGEAGRVFLGVKSMNKNTGSGLIKEYWPTGAGGGVADEFEVVSPDGTNSLRPSDYYVDANSPGEGLIVSYWVK